MLIEAVIENGQVRLLKPVQFVHNFFSVKVDIPDNEIRSIYKAVTQKSPIEQKNADVAEFKELCNALFANGYRYIPEKSDEEILAEILSEKYGR